MIYDSLKCKEEVRYKILHKHAVTLNEVEEVFENGRAYMKRESTDRLLAFGQTDAGRYLFCVITRPEKRKDRRVCRLITAREMTEKEKRAYRKRRT